MKQPLKEKLKQIGGEHLLNEAPKPIKIVKVGTIVNPRFDDGYGMTIDFNYGNQMISLDKKAFEALLKIYKKNKSKIK